MAAANGCHFQSGGIFMAVWNRAGAGDSCQASDSRQAGIYHWGDALAHTDSGMNAAREGSEVQFI